MGVEHHALVDIFSGNNPGCPMNRRIGGAHNRSRRLGEQINLWPLQGFELRTTRPVAQSLYQVRTAGQNLGFEVLPPSQQQRSVTSEF
jgi:hypothetical protein